MKRLASCILSVIFYFVFFFLLLLFHPIQWIAFHIFGYHAHKKTVDALNFCLVHSLLILGNKCKIINQHEIPENRPIIFVSNHQSMFDIPMLIWQFRKHHVKFVSKKELGKGIPSISFNLRHGGSVLIDRKNGDEAVKILKQFGNYLCENKYAAVIFPEGTRSKNGKLKHFSTKGITAIVKNCPNVILVPITINESYKMHQTRGIPLPLGLKMTWTIHQPEEVNLENLESQFKRIEQNIATALNS